MNVSINLQPEYTTDSPSRNPTPPSSPSGTCVAPEPRRAQGAGFIPQERRHYGSALEKRKAPFAIQPSCGLKSALRSLAQRPRYTDTPLDGVEGQGEEGCCVSMPLLATWIGNRSLEIDHRRETSF